MDIISGIAAASQAITIAKTLREIEKSYDIATTKAQLVELIENLSDAKLSLIDAKEREVELEAEVTRLRTATDEQSKLIVGKDGYKYRSDADGKAVGYPVCPRCEAIEKRVIPLVPEASWNVGKCPACAGIFKPVDPVGTESKAEAEAEKRRVDQIMVAGYRNDYDPWNR